MNLSTSYLGLDMPTPFIVGSSDLTANANNLKKCEQYGAGAVVLKSLFEEQILQEINSKLQDNDMYYWYPEATEFIKGISGEHNVNQYLDLVREAKESVNIPVIASINCISADRWTHYAKKVEEAGADALEVNIYIPAGITDEHNLNEEEIYLEVIRKVKRNTSLPVSVKLGYYFTNLARTLLKISKSGVEGVVLFNRFYTPDIDIDEMKILTDKNYSAPTEQHIPLRWIALLSNQVDCDLVASTGIHDAQAAIRMILAGATAVQSVSALYQNGLKHLEKMVNDTRAWMEKKNFKSLDDFRGKMATKPEFKAEMERVQFMKRSFGL